MSLNIIIFFLLLLSQVVENRVNRYHILDGNRYSPEIYWIDSKYNGQKNERNELINGTGCLVDKNSSENDNPFLSSSCWVGWKLNITDNPAIFIVLAQPNNMAGIFLRTYVNRSMGALPIKKVVILASNRKPLVPIGSLCSPDYFYSKKTGVIDYYISLNNISFQYLQLNLEYSGDWILVRLFEFIKPGDLKDTALRLSDIILQECIIPEPISDKHEGKKTIFNVTIISIIGGSLLILVVATIAICICKYYKRRRIQKDKYNNHEYENIDRTASETTRDADRDNKDNDDEDYVIFPEEDVERIPVYQYKDVTPLIRGSNTDGNHDNKDSDDEDYVISPEEEVERIPVYQNKNVTALTRGTTTDCNRDNKDSDDGDYVISPEEDVERIPVYQNRDVTALTRGTTTDGNHDNKDIDDGDYVIFPEEEVERVPVYQNKDVTALTRGTTTDGNRDNKDNDDGDYVISPEEGVEEDPVYQYIDPKTLIGNNHNKKVLKSSTEQKFEACSVDTTGGAFASYVTSKDGDVVYKQPSGVPKYQPPGESPAGCLQDPSSWREGKSTAVSNQSVKYDKPEINSIPEYEVLRTKKWAPNTKEYQELQQ